MMVWKHFKNTNYKTTNRGDKCGVNTGWQGCYINGGTFACHAHKSFHHSGNCSQKSNHGCSCGSCSQYSKPFFKLSNFYITHVFHSTGYVSHWSPQSGYSFLHHSCCRSICFTTKR